MLATYFFLISIIVFSIFLLYFYPSWRDERILNKAMPTHWMEIIESKLPFYHKLAQHEQKQLIDLLKLFIAKKKFHGCGGLLINDEIRVTIAVEACLLLLNRKVSLYPRLKHILVYPSAFSANRQHQNSDGTFSSGSKGLLGESWHFGKVILSWDDVEAGVSNIYDGHNVALHEFAHQLDSESGSANGAPILRKNSYVTWAKVLSDEFEALSSALSKQHKSVLDFYGATNPAEFFAVATETFFEKPNQMKKKHPELYNEFKQYYSVDPSQWQ